MFIIEVDYLCPLAEVDRLLPAHVEYLNKYYQEGVFLLSGRKVPRTGGIIMAAAESREDLQKIMDEDPFAKAGIAHYEVTEFHPTKAASSLEAIINK